MTPGFPIDYVAVTWAASDDVIDEHDYAAGASELHGGVRFRHDGVWGSWVAFVEEGAQAPGQWSSSVVYAAGAEAYQIRGVPSWAESPRAIAISSSPATLATQSLTESACLSRAEWGADESKRFVDSVESWVPTFFPVQGLIVHHTVTANDDPDPAATVRAIYHHHVLPPHQHPRQRRQSMDRWPVRVATRLRTHPPSLEGPAYRSAAETPNPATPHRAPAHIGTYALAGSMVTIGCLRGWRS